MLLLTPYLRLTAVFVAFREGSFTIITFGLEPYFFNSHAEKAIVKEERRRRKSFFIMIIQQYRIGPRDSMTLTESQNWIDNATQWPPV